MVELKIIVQFQNQKCTKCTKKIVNQIYTAWLTQKQWYKKCTIVCKPHRYYPFYSVTLEKTSKSAELKWSKM